MHDVTNLLEAQRTLQVMMNQKDPTKMSEEERALFIKDMVLASTDELHELLQEVGWKPWATSRHVNVEAAKGEWIDLLHFVLNLGLAIGFRDGSEIEARYMQKRMKNVKRQQAGYDGVTGKCPQCARALDDDAVTCRVVEGVPYCALAL